LAQAAWKRRKAEFLERCQSRAAAGGLDRHRAARRPLVLWLWGGGLPLNGLEQDDPEPGELRPHCIRIAVGEGFALAFGT
jgi:hypothetical protein